MFLMAVGLEREALADPTAEDRTISDALFQEAKELMKNGSYDQACPKLEESQRLDPREGTLLNLAVCHEKQGRVASAWVEYKESLAAAEKGNRWTRIRVAKEGVARLQARVPYLAVDVGTEARPAGFTVRRRGVDLQAPAWGAKLPVDPGEHLIEALAPGMKTWSETVTLAEHEVKTVVVPALEPEPVVAPVEEPVATKNKPKPSPKPALHESNGRMYAYIAGGIGVVGLGVGTYFGLQAFSKNSDSDKFCRQDVCGPQGMALHEDAKRAALLSNIGFGVGVVGLGLSTYFLLSDTGGSAVPSTIEATATSDGAVLTIQGLW